MSRLRIVEEERRKPRRMPWEERKKILQFLKGVLESEVFIEIAVVHGGFVESEIFRDIDIAVYLVRISDSLTYVDELRDRLERALGIAIDIQVLNEAPPYFIYKALSRGRIIVEKQPGLATLLKIRALEEYKKLKNLHQKILDVEPALDNTK